MRGYFDKRRSLNDMINYNRRADKRFRNIIAKQEAKVEEIRRLLENPVLNLSLDDPKFREAEDIKQQAYYLLGENKHLVREAKLDKKAINERQRYYERKMQILID